MKFDVDRHASTGQHPARRCRILRPLLLAALISVGGCASHPKPNVAALQANWKGPTTQSLSIPTYDPDVFAVCDPPSGWHPDPLKKNDTHTHQVWVSPTGATAYGVIHFKLPFPVGQDMALGGFLKQMKQSSGNANLISQQNDPNLPGIRFVAEGGLYRIRTNFMVDGWEGWAVYAGTVIKKPVNAGELDTAIRARDHTSVGRPETSGK